MIDTFTCKNNISNIYNINAYYNRYMNREINKSNLAKELGASRPTLDKLIEEYKNK